MNANALGEFPGNIRCKLRNQKIAFPDKSAPVLQDDTDNPWAEKNDISVLFGEWGTPYKMHDLEEGHGDKFTGANDPKWINIIVKYLDYLINEKGYTCLKYPSSFHPI